MSLLCRIFGHKSPAAVTLSSDGEHAEIVCPRCGHRHVAKVEEAVLSWRVWSNDYFKEALSAGFGFVRGQ
jgi:DNA-directed RNA polymerase subunit RPC12/RpoP